MENCGDLTTCLCLPTHKKNEKSDIFVENNAVLAINVFLVSSTKKNIKKRHFCGKLCRPAQKRLPKSLRKTKRKNVIFVGNCADHGRKRLPDFAKRNKKNVIFVENFLIFKIFLLKKTSFLWNFPHFHNFSSEKKRHFCGKLGPK